MRRENRQVVSRPARVELGEGNVIQCRIANLSPGGAMLIMPNSEWLPQTFLLVDTFSNIRREVRLMWTAPDRAGVRFIAGGIAPTVKRNEFGKRG